MKKKFRDNVLDALKGVALLLMLLAHSENLFNNGNNQTLSAANTIGITFSLTLFIFASGVGGGYLYFKDKLEDNIYKKTFKRFLSIYAVYAFLNFLYIGLYSPLAWSRDKIIDALIFKRPQIYTEFLIPLMFLPVVALIVRKLPKVVCKNIFVFAAVIIGIYLIGAFGATVNWGEGIRPFAVLLFGSFSEYRYPIIQYAVVYLVGLRFGLYLLKKPSEKVQRRDIGQSFLVSGLLTLSCLFTSSMPPSEFDFLRRWPPGIGFMLYGIVLSFAIYYINTFIPKNKIWKGLAWLGKMTLAVFWLHITLIYIYVRFLDYQFVSVIFAAVTMLCFIVLSILLGFLYTNLFGKSKTKLDIRIFLIALILVIFNVGIIVGSVYAESKSFADITDNVPIENFAVDIDKEPTLNAQSTRVWIIKNSQVSEDLSSATIKITLNQKLRYGRGIVVIVEGDNKKLVINAEKVNDFNYKVVIKAADLNTGEYKIHAEMNDRSATASNELTMNVSYPLIVTWTLDYEGYDVSNKNLSAIAAFSEKYGMPLTHLFNPRIFIAEEVSKSRSNYLVNWVLDRYTKNSDEIGLHMHMHCDMITAIGMTPKTEPRWGGRTNCHDVLTSAYNYEEFTQIIEWAKGQFELHGLPEPLTFRAGGWFIEETQLKVLQDQGFLVDTSGRTSYTWGTQKGPWGLSETTTPYNPSTKNQNRSTPAPTLSLAEIPNNGWDSTNNNSDILKNAFDKNYQNVPLNELQVLTYMSHPHWFVTYDQNRVNDVLKYIGANKAVDDKGPVIYLTIQQAYEYWNKK